MSILGNILRDLTSVIFPNRCIVCGETVDSSVHGICLSCRLSIPTTGFCYRHQNPIREHFEGLFPVDECSSFFIFKADDSWQRMIHNFKYHDKWGYALTMGRWFGAELRASGHYNDIDLVIPIPLHWRKSLKRGYNQSTYIAEGIAREIGAKLDSSTVCRTKNNPSQTRQHVKDRWSNVDDIFTVRDATKLENKHILLVDDVLTTGATISSCARAILNATPTCRVSIVTLAVAGELAKRL